MFIIENEKNIESDSESSVEVIIDPDACKMQPKLSYEEILSRQNQAFTLLCDIRKDSNIMNNSSIGSWIDQDDSIESTYRTCHRFNCSFAHNIDELRTIDCRNINHSAPFQINHCRFFHKNFETKEEYYHKLLKKVEIKNKENKNEEPEKKFEKKFEKLPEKKSEKKSEKKMTFENSEKKVIQDFCNEMNIKFINASTMDDKIRTIFEGQAKKFKSNKFMIYIPS